MAEGMGWIASAFPLHPTRLATWGIEAPLLHPDHHVLNADAVRAEASELLAA
jgi:hypothetical protein